MASAQQTLTVTFLLVIVVIRSLRHCLEPQRPSSEIWREDSSSSSCSSGPISRGMKPAPVPRSQGFCIGTGASGPGPGAPRAQILDLAHFLEPLHNQREKKKKKRKKEKEQKLEDSK